MSMNLKKHDLGDESFSDLYAHLKTNDINQKDLASAMGISPQALSYQIKNGTYRLSKINDSLEQLGAPPFQPNPTVQIFEGADFFKETIFELRETIKNQDVYIKRLLDLLGQK